MEFKEISKKENALFKRKEIEGSIESEITPSRLDVLEILAKKFSVDSEVIKIKGIHGKFGSKTFMVSVNIYESVEDKNSIEPKKKKDQLRQVEEQPTETAEVAPAEEPAEKPVSAEEEKPAEEKPVEEKLAEKKEEGVNDSNKTSESADQKDSELKSNNKSEQSGEANKE